MKRLDGYLISYTLPHRQELTSAIVEDHLYHIVNAIHHPCITPIHQSIQSRMLSKFKITCTVKPDNETHDQLTDTCNVSAKRINYMRN